MPGSAVDVFDDSRGKPESFERDFHDMIFKEKENEYDRHSHKLSDNCGDGRALDSHRRTSKVPEDKDRIQNDIRDTSRDI